MQRLLHSIVFGIMGSKIIFLLFVAISVTAAREWWEGTNFYQIYPRSFKDSNGDGIGDLKGVTEKLTYLKDLGIAAAWLSPIMKSPMADFGYDISDYRTIQPEYGTMQDFENLLAKAKEIGLRIILDFVPNHTSDEHEWFQKSIRKEGKYTNYYIWNDGRPDPNNSSRRLPPNNWVSVFRYSAWKWNDVRKQFYLHQFAAKQPDLNYRDVNVVNEMKDILRFWLRKGVSGFRIDAVPFLFENQTLANEPVDPSCPDPDDYCHTKHIYTNDLDETFEMAYQWRAVLDEFKDEPRVMLTEAYTSLENIIRFYGDGVRNGSHVPFNFDLITKANNFTKATEFLTLINDWMKLMPPGVYANWVMGNHDNKRLASRYGKNRADLLNIMLQTLPGIGVTYNGEEIAMTDVWVSWNDTVDPQGCNTNESVYNTYSRDPARTPFQWDSTKNAGFSTASKTWLPVSPDYQTNNVLLQRKAQRSHLRIFRKLTRLRLESSFQFGTFERKTIGNDILIYKRELSGSDIYIVILNFGKVNTQVNLKQHYPNVDDTVEVVVASLQSSYLDGAILRSNNITSYGEVGIVLRSV